MSSIGPVWLIVRACDFHLVSAKVDHIMKSDKDVYLDKAGEETRLLVETLLQAVPGTEIVAVATDDSTSIPGFELDPVVGTDAAHAYEVIRAKVLAKLKGVETVESFVTRVNGIEWGVLANPVTIRGERVVGALIVARHGRTWSKRERVMAASYASLLSHVATLATREGVLLHQRRLDELVAQVAERLMSASATNRQEVLDWVMKVLAEFLSADISFLRRNDLHRNVSVLEAEWPIRDDKPDPDPLYEVSFDADPIFMATRDLRKPYLTGGVDIDEVYKDRANEGAGVIPSDGAAVPLLLGETTWGIIGFLHLNMHNWMPEEVRALQAVASLLVQMQARIDAEDRTRYNANHDELTGLPNRRALVEELKRRLTMRNRFAVMVIDLDRFKIMNDYLGHGNGDRLLMTIADRIRTSIRANDFAARLGGDEFVLILDKATSELEVMATAYRIRDAIAKPVDINGQEVSHTASLGIAFSDSGEHSGLEYLGWADVAMYAAKSRGGNLAVVFDQELRQSVNDRSQTELMLRDAIDGDGLRLHFQPEVDIRTGRLLAVESLVRWEHPTRGLLAAAEFITVAEETGMVTDIGRWVFAEACRQLGEWQRDFPDLPMKVRVNMSPADFRQPSLIPFVRRVIEENNVPGNRLCVEVTEYAALDDFQNATRVIKSLQDLGIEIALDDFGTGTASMTELKNLPVDLIKLDMSFVRGVTTDNYDRAIVESIIRLGDALNLGVIAEGIESSSVADKLLELGCYRGQGYLISRPVPANELTAMLRAGAVAPSLLRSSAPRRAEIAL